jgi:hypothetical protein
MVLDSRRASTARLAAMDAPSKSQITIVYSWTTETQIL